jgi:hypothetical protein
MERKVAVGAGTHLIRTAAACYGARDQPAGGRLGACPKSRSCNTLGGRAG